MLADNVPTYEAIDCRRRWFGIKLPLRFLDPFLFRVDCQAPVRAELCLGPRFTLSILNENYWLTQAEGRHYFRKRSIFAWKRKSGVAEHGFEVISFVAESG